MGAVHDRDLLRGSFLLAERVTVMPGDRGVRSVGSTRDGTRRMENRTGDDDL